MEHERKKQERIKKVQEDAVENLRVLTEMSARKTALNPAKKAVTAPVVVKKEVKKSGWMDKWKSGLDKY